MIRINKMSKLSKEIEIKNKDKNYKFKVFVEMDFDHEEMWFKLKVDPPKGGKIKVEKYAGQGLEQYRRRPLYGWCGLFSEIQRKATEIRFKNLRKTTFCVQKPNLSSEMVVEVKFKDKSKYNLCISWNQSDELLVTVENSLK